MRVSVLKNLLLVTFACTALAACAGKDKESQLGETIMNQEREAITQSPIETGRRDGVSADRLGDIPGDYDYDESTYDDTAVTAEPGTQAHMAQTVGDRAFFGFDRYDLSPEARETLKNQAEWLRRYPDLTVTIEGHTDERGTREYNLALGDRRATSARNYLVALGIDPNRISTVSYGKERPAALGSNEEAWAKNRRAKTTID